MSNKQVLIDSHCHLNCLEFERLGLDLEGVLVAARSAGVKEMLCVSIELETLPDVLAIARTHPDIYASVGVHPNVTEGEDPDCERLVALAAEDKVVAIGETGLDYFRGTEGQRSAQRRRFLTHIESARITGKPLIIHSRDADADTIELLQTGHASDVGGVMHCFASDWAMAEAVLALGLYISFSGIVTFKSASQLRSVAARVPRDRILIETDSPYLAPVPHRGKTNQPAYVRHVAECLAQLRGVDVDEIAALSRENFRRLFFSHRGH